MTAEFDSALGCYGSSTGVRIRLLVATYHIGPLRLQWNLSRERPSVSFDVACPGVCVYVYIVEDCLVFVCKRALITRSFVVKQSEEFLGSSWL